jgi:hypothetical protein
MTNSKAVAATIRHQLKALGIVAKVRMTPGSTDSVQVNAPTFDTRFTEDEQRAIRTTGRDLGLTWVRGLPIDVERMTDPHGCTFYLS